MIVLMNGILIWDVFYFREGRPFYILERETGCGGEQQPDSVRLDYAGGSEPENAGAVH